MIALEPKYGPGGRIFIDPLRILRMQTTSSHQYWVQDYDECIQAKESPAQVAEMIAAWKHRHQYEDVYGAIVIYVTYEDDKVVLAAVPKPSFEQ